MVELVKDGVYWIRLADRRLCGSTDWQIARQCFDDKFMLIGMLLIVDSEDIAEIGPLVVPPGAPAPSASADRRCPNTPSTRKAHQRADVRGLCQYAGV